MALSGGVRPGAEHRAAAELHAARSASTWIAGGWPAVARLRLPALAVAAQPHQHRGGEVVEAGALEQQLVDPRQHLARARRSGGPARAPSGAARPRRRRRRCPCRRRRRSGSSSRPRWAARRRGRRRSRSPRRRPRRRRRSSSPGTVGRPRRAQAALQVLRDPVALLVEAGVVEGQRGAVAELAEELQVAGVVAQVAAGVEEGEGAERAAAGDQRHHRRRVVAGVVRSAGGARRSGRPGRSPRARSGRARPSAGPRAAPARPGARRRGRAARARRISSSRAAASGSAPATTLSPTQPSRADEVDHAELGQLGHRGGDDRARGPVEVERGVERRGSPRRGTPGRGGAASRR